MRKVIKRIFDEILDLPPPAAPVVEDATMELQPPEFDVSAFLGSEEDPDLLDWLNSVEWTRDVLQDAWT